MMTLSQGALGVVSGSFVGFALGLLGGGGSILAMPLMIYLVGVESPHVALGTSAVAVAASAAANLANHARQGTVKWRCVTLFAITGVAGAFGGSSLGKMIDGQKLIVLFALLMMAVGALMLRKRSNTGDPAVMLNRGNAPALVALGFGSGALSGFFGIGGGFLIVPGLMLATGMPILNATASSLVAVTAFGLTTAANYAVSGLVDWPLAGLFLAGGLAGGLLGAQASMGLAARRGTLETAFAGIIFAVSLYMAFRGWQQLS